MKPRPERKILSDLVDKLDMDTVIYELTEIAWQKRDAAKDNPAEEAYWQHLGRILTSTQERLGDS